MNKYIEIWFWIHVSKSVKVHEKHFYKFFENKMAALNLLQTNRFFLDSLLGRTTTGCNVASRTKNEKDSENIYRNEVNNVGFFRKIEISKNPTMFTLFLYIFSEYFSAFVLGAKSRTVVIRPRRLSKKNRFVCERLYTAILFSKNLLNIFSCTLRLVETWMQNQISIYLFICF